MRRDILILINYYYKEEYDKSVELFNNILKDIKNTDLDFILDNKLYKFIPRLEGLYLETNIKLKSILDKNELKHYNIEDTTIDNLLDNISSKLSNEIIRKLNIFWDMNYNKFNSIIDGGNAIYHNKGKYNLDNINKIVNYYNNSLIIIHKKHNYKSDKLYFNTYYNYNDDIFILWFFLKSKCKYNIITNDKYKDHIYKYNIPNDIYSHLHNKIINYDLENLNFYIKPTYSICIQQIKDNKYAIPTINNDFIVI
jgi:hypothetical protein